MRSLVRAPFVAVKRTFKVPSSRRGWYCSAATRLQPPVAERPARTAPGFVRPCQSRVRGSRSGRARRSRAPRGRRAASFFYADRECGRARRARWAARTPPQALGTRSHAPLSSSPPTALRTADRRSRSNAPARVVGVRALWQSVNQRPLSGWLVMCLLECLGALFCRTSGLNMRPGFAR